MEKFIWILLGSLLMLSTACGDGEEIPSGNGDNSGNGGTDVVEEPLKPELIRLKVGLGTGILVDTRLDYRDKENIKLLWGENDKIRVYWKDYDNKYHSSVFTLKDGVGTSEGTFEGMAPKSLPKSSNYQFLYPADKFEETYSGNEDFGGQLLFPVTGQKQVGNHNMDHLADYNYLMSTQPTVNNFSFEQNFMSLMKFELTLPDVYDLETCGKLVSLTLRPLGDWGKFFIKSGNRTRYYYDPIDLTLENVSLSEDHALTAYMMTYAMELYSGQKYSVVLTTDQGDMYNFYFINQTSSSIIQETGKLYTIQGIVTPDYGDYLTVDPMSHTINIAVAEKLTSIAITHAVGTENPGHLILDGQVTKNDLSRIRNWLWDHPDLSLSVTLASSTLTEMPSGYFACENLRSITAPYITSIEKGALENCTGLTSVNFPLVTSLGERAFASCKNLSSVNFPLVKSIGERAFLGTSLPSVTSMNFPVVTNIGEGAFWSCENLSSVNIPTAISIGEYAFANCKNLSSVNLPAVTKLGGGAFTAGILNPYLVNLSSSNPIFYDSYSIPLVVNSNTTDLVLHKNNKNMVSGLRWANTVWKSISYVDDNGDPVTE